jgi:hypothetical protein
MLTLCHHPLGGKDNYDADWQAARHNRAFLARAVR